MGGVRVDVEDYYYTRLDSSVPSLVTLVTIISTHPTYHHHNSAARWH